MLRSTLPLALLLLVAATPPLEAARRTLEGRAALAWGDPRPEAIGSRAPAVLELVIQDDAGREHRFELERGRAPEGIDPSGLKGRRVRATVDDARPRTQRLVAVQVVDEPAASAVALGVEGSQPFVTLLCRFAGDPSEPVSPSELEAMNDHLDGYWREISWDRMDLVGSSVAPAWVDLPHPQSHYVPTPGVGCLDSVSGNEAKRGELFDDCVAAADDLVDFSAGGAGGYSGIHLAFNAQLDGCAWGSVYYASLDGVARAWGATWLPPWASTNAAVYAHEAGHTFGWQHSNNWDGDSDTYDHVWDVMSSIWYHAVSGTPFGTIGKHAIAPHLEQAGWIEPSDVFEPADPGVYEIELAELALAPPVSGYRMARLRIPGTNVSWLLEARRRTGAFDAALPGDAVIVHEERPDRWEDLRAYDAAVPPGDLSNGDGVEWVVGETFEDVDQGISFTVDAETAEGYAVTVRYLGSSTAAIFIDGFEAGDFGAWTTASP